MTTRMKIPHYQICFHKCSGCHEIIEITIKDDRESHRGHKPHCPNSNQTDCFEAKPHTARL
jgi:hypothetical protein